MHLATYTPAEAGKLLAHYDRSIGPRDHIDPGLPVYNLAPGDARERYAALTEGLEVCARTRPLADIVVTVPKEYDGDPGELLEAAYGYLRDRVGEGLVVSAFVHMDEPGAQPHMHFAFVPVVESVVMENDKTAPLLWTKADERKNPAHKAGTQKTDSKGTLRWKRVPKMGRGGMPKMRRTASASKMFSKADMRELHPAMERHLCAALGVERVGMVLDEESAEKRWSNLDHADYERVTAARAQALDELAEAQERLESVRQETGRVEAQVRDLEPAAEGIAASAGALIQNRGARRREEELAAEVAGLRADLERAEDERETQQAILRGAESERRELEESVRGLGERLETLVERLRAVLSGFECIPGTLTDLARTVAAEMGLWEYDPAVSPRERGEELRDDWYDLAMERQDMGRAAAAYDEPMSWGVGEWGDDER